jgi:hypothetical protein
MATTQLLDGSIRICKVLTPNPRTEWQLEVTSPAGVTVTLGVDFPLREFFKEVLDLYLARYQTMWAMRVEYEAILF